MIISKSVFLITLLICSRAQAVLRHYNFTLSEELLNPDCYSEGYVSPLINGQFPGPAIYANQGDEVEVLIKNQFKSMNASIHFHGIRQIGTVESDGVPGVTQNPISPGATFLHRFKLVDQAGTYFYHAHIGLQDDSVQGPLVVYETPDANPQEAKAKNLTELTVGPYKYDDELVLQLSEWWHEKLEKREGYYLGSEFYYDKGADSILLNGNTIHDQDRDGISEDNCKGYVSLNVNPNTRYRLRVIGGNTFRTLGLAIKDHNLTVIEVDGELVKPYDVSYLEITPGQRFSVLLNTGSFKPDSTFAIATTYLWRQRGRGYTKNGYGYLRYKKPNWVEEDTLFQLFPDDPVQPPKEESGRGGGGDYSNGRDGGSNGGSNGNNTIEVHGGKGVPEHQKIAKFYKDNDDDEDYDYDYDYDDDEEDEDEEDEDEDDDDDDDEDDDDEDGEDNDDEDEDGEDNDDEDEDDDDEWDYEDDYEDDEDDNDDENNEGDDEYNHDESHDHYGWGHWRDDHEGDGWNHWRDDSDKDREADVNYAHMHGADFIYLPKAPPQKSKQQSRGNGGRRGNDKPVAIFDKLPKFPTEDLKNWFWHQLVPLKDREPIVDLKDVKTIKLKSTMKRMPDNSTRYFINEREPHTRHTCALDEVKKHSYKQIFTDDSDYNTAINAYSVGYNQTIDLVFQNSVYDGGCLLHPWHTHGHSHYLIATGEGEYVHEQDKDIRTFKNPLYKDVSVVYPSHPPLEYKDGQGCGWTKVRILTDNPGIWAVHCHITTHMLQGKMIILEEASDLIEKHKLYQN